MSYRAYPLLIVFVLCALVQIGCSSDPSGQIIGVWVFDEARTGDVNLTDAQAIARFRETTIEFSADRSMVRTIGNDRQEGYYNATIDSNDRFIIEAQLGGNMVRWTVTVVDRNTINLQQARQPSLPLKRQGS